jgi:DNA ligase (NAD+)
MASRFVEKFKKQGISVLDSLSEKQFESLIKSLNNAYYNDESMMTDNEYDIIKEYFERKFPTNRLLDNIGAPIKKNKVTLPYFMPSMDKIKPTTNALYSWMKDYKGPYVLSCKLDGVSGMYISNDKTRNLYTRGDGRIGQDVTHLLRALELPIMKDVVVRGEFILSKKTFHDKYKSRFSNARNLVSGIINSTTIDEKTRDMDFIAYEVIHPRMTPQDQMKYLIRNGFNTVRNATFADVTNELLSQILVDWREQYEYDIDGIIVSDNNNYDRTEGNPKQSFAFKMVISDQVAEAKVIDVIWSPSKNGYLKPRVRIEPINIGGVNIEYATGFNGKFIESNKIGIGAVIRIIRSGDVIPYIQSITVPSEVAKMPTEPYHWTESEVDIVLNNINDNMVVQQKNITDFFTTLKVDGLSSGNVNRLMKAGYNTITKIIYMKKEDFKTVEGFGEKMVDKIHDGIRLKLEDASLVKIMSASNMLGRGLGEKKINLIMDRYPNILTSLSSNDEKYARLVEIDGIGKENASSFLDNMSNFINFLREIGKSNMLTRSPKRSMPVTKDSNHILNGKRIAMTKVRDARVLSLLEQHGGILDNSVTKNTFLLITKSMDDVSSKMKKAEELGIPVLTPDDFLKEYLK